MEKVDKRIHISEFYDAKLGEESGLSLQRTANHGLLFIFRITFLR